jgi:hypothetical protein
MLVRIRGPLARAASPVAIAVAIGVSAAVLAPARLAAGDDGNDALAPDSELRDLDDPSVPYRTPRAGEGFRARVLGDGIEFAPRDRRSVSAWTVGLMASAPGADESEILPFASLFFWRRPDADTMFRAVVVGVYNEIFFAKSNEALGPWEGILTFENFIVPAESGELVDGTRIDEEELFAGYARPGIGIGYRREVAPFEQDSLFSVEWTIEPGWIGFEDGADTAADFVVPRHAFELRSRLRARWDALERNLLELPHRGWALGADLVGGHRFGWRDWGRGGRERADAGDEFVTASAYAVIATPIPGVESERHRLLAYLHAGIGESVDRFSALRLGGGPQGEEYLALSRPVLPGATIDEFSPEHYIVLVAEYRFEPIFFTYIGPRASIAALDRDRRRASGIRRDDDVLASLGARLTSGFVGDLRIQIDYNFGFGIIRRGDFGGHEVMFQISRSF